jgi:hypothetical protein
MSKFYSNLTEEDGILNAVLTMKPNLFPPPVPAINVQGLKLLFVGKGDSIHTQVKLFSQFELDRRTFLHHYQFR